MAAVRDQSDTDNWLSRCTIASLLPRTLGSSSSSHAAVSESEDADFVGNLLKSTAMKDSTQLLEQAKTIINSSCSSIPDGSFGWKDVLNKRADEVQVELQGKRNRQRRPGLAGLERAKHAFNFSAKTTTASSQMLTSELFKGAAEAKAPAAESWPVIDYSCLKNISDPVEYFSTYRMLENAEKEVKRLKGEVSLKPSQPHGKRDRQRRPGLSNLDGRKAVFRFPHVASSVKHNSLVEKPSLSECSNITEVAVTSPFKESKIDKKADEFEQLLSACRDVDDDIGIANCIREILQLNPIYMGKIGVPGSPSAREHLLQNCQLGQISPGTTTNNVNLLPILKRRVSLINSQGDVFLPPNGNIQVSGSCRNSDVVENLKGNGTGDQNDDFEKVMSTNFGMMATSSMEGSLNNSLFCPEKTAIEADLLSSLKPMSLMNIGARLDEISTLKRRIASQNTNDIQPVVFTHDNSGDHTLSKSQEPNSLSPVKGIHVDGSVIVDNVFNEVMPNGRKLCFEGKVNSPIAGTFVVDRNTSKSIVDDVPKQCPHSLLDDVGGRMDGGLGEKEFVSIVTSAGFEKASQALVSVDHGVSNCLVNTSSDKLSQHFGSSGATADLPVELLHTEAPKDDHLPEESTLMGEHVARSHNILDASNGNHGNVVEFGKSRGRNPKRKAPVRKQNKRESISRRKSLAGAGTVIEHGLRRSTRIKMKPLQYWCGERFLYGRVHDSLATVIGVKKLATPGKDGRPVMKVKSYVSEQYADLVAQAALH